MRARRGGAASAVPRARAAASGAGADAGTGADAVAEADADAAAARQALICEAVAVLHDNGASSERTTARAAQLADALGVSARVDLGWGSTAVEVGGGAGEARAATTTRLPTIPSAVGMNRVLAVDEAIDRLAAEARRARASDAGDHAVADARAAVARAAALQPANVVLFAAACALGASCLAIIFGITHGQTVLIIALVSAAGAFLRRGIGALGGNNFWQVGLAALLAGLVGALATNADLSSSLRLAAVCPCMVLVPGPHLLNGSLDLAALRIPLGLARLAFAALTLLSIGAGLLIGLRLGGAELVVDPAGRDIPLWLDAASAGVVAVCYGIFYSAPLRILGWPLIVGAAVHALRWVALDVWHLEPWLGAGLACLAAAVILVPVSRRFQVPFSAIGFASVVSLMPGVLIFRAFAGLASLQTASGAEAGRMLVATVADANTALLTIVAMAIGFIVPAGVYGWVQGRLSRGRTGNDGAAGRSLLGLGGRRR